MNDFTLFLSKLGKYALYLQGEFTETRWKHTLINYKKHFQRNETYIVCIGSRYG